jgi:Domain of unknown function (DUF4126)
MACPRCRVALVVDTAYILPIVLGISLAAATGFRVFLPLMISGIAMRTGYLPQGETLAWIATTPALLMLAVAATAEIAAYYLPGIDNALDAIATPTAAIAGIAVSATIMADLPPMLKWTLAIIAGGGAATVTQSATTLARAKSTLFTGGLGNHVIATTEIIAAVILPLIAIIFPYVALAFVLAFLYVIWRLVRNEGRHSQLHGGPE